MMKYFLEKLTDLEIIKVTVDSTLDQNTRKEIHLKATNELSLNMYHRLLIDVRNSRLSQSYTTGESLDMINYMNKVDMQKNTKIAFLCEYKESPRKTFVTTAQLIGEINIRQFDKLNKAIEWLCEMSYP